MKSMSSAFSTLSRWISERALASSLPQGSGFGPVTEVSKLYPDGRLGRPSRLFDGGTHLAHCGAAWRRGLQAGKAPLLRSPSYQAFQVTVAWSRAPLWRRRPVTWGPCWSPRIHSRQKVRARRTTNKCPGLSAIQETGRPAQHRQLPAPSARAQHRRPHHLQACPPAHTWSAARTRQ